MATSTYTCPVTRCGFVSKGWPSKAAADRRGVEHQTEHSTRKPMPELADTKA